MAKKQQLDGETIDDRIKQSCMSQVEQLYDKHHKRFLRALEDNEAKRLNLDFSATVDKSEIAPMVTVSMSFRDKDKEAGMEVNKTFHAKVSEEIEDPNQPALLPKE